MTKIIGVILHRFWEDQGQYRGDSIAQQVEHNTFNVGVPGSSPGWITRKGNFGSPFCFDIPLQTLPNTAESAYFFRQKDRNQVHM